MARFTPSLCPGPVILELLLESRLTSGLNVFVLQENEESFYRSTYRTVESASDVRDVLEVDGALSLAIKAGALAARGIGAYVKSAATAQDSVDVLFKVSYRTVSGREKLEKRCLIHHENPAVNPIPGLQLTDQIPS